MKKIYSILIGLLITGQSVKGQIITQSAEGVGTVIMEGSAISLDLGKTDLSFGWNNLNKNIVKSNNGFLIGGEVKVKNSDGIGSLFSKGELVPQGGANLFFGRYWSNATKGSAFSDISNEEFLKSLKQLTEIAVVLLHDTLYNEIDAIAEKHIADPQKRNNAVKALLDEYEDIKNKLFFPVRISEDDNDLEIKAFKTALKKRLMTVKENVEKPYRALSNPRFSAKVEFNKGRKRLL